MSARMRLMRYEAGHREAMLALHRSAIVGFELGMSREEDEADLMAIEEVYLGDGGEFLVGMVEGRLVAMGGYRRVSKTEAELRRMRIAPELQGRGLGTELLRALEGLARAAGMEAVCLETARRRPLTLAFYRKHGYEEAGAGRYGAVETVRFRKRLGGAG